MSPFVLKKLRLSGLHLSESKAINAPAPTSGAVVLAAGDDDELILLLNCHQSAKSEAQGDWLRGQFALQLEIQAWVKEAQRDRRRGSTGVQTSRAKKICGKAAPAFAQAK
nr:hypothetical protein Iba_chr13fCG7950 [Ipomoea batatas]